MPSYTAFRRYREGLNLFARRVELMAPRAAFCIDKASTNAEGMTREKVARPQQSTAIHSHNR